MKVLLIDVNCKGSSTGKIVYDTFVQIRKSGHEAAICYGRGDLIKENGIYKFGLDWETNIHAALSRITGLNGCYSPVSTARLIRYIDEFKPDVIHIHELHAYFVNLKPLLEYIKDKQIPVVWTFHCEYMYTGKCGHANECENWKTECDNCPAIQGYPKSLFFDQTRRMFREKKRLLQDMDITIVTPSEWLADRVRQSFLKDRSIKVIHNGIDTNIFCPRDVAQFRKQHGLEGKKVIISVAPNIMGDAKGGKKIIEMSQMTDDPRIQFVLVGAEQTEKYSNNVQLIARTKDQNELAMWYSLADIFVICSIKENFPTTCLEAQCCGTQISGFDTGGSKETSVCDGLFVEYGQTEQLFKKICTYINGTKLYSDEEISLKARKKYSRESMYEEYFKLYCLKRSVRLSKVVG